MPDMEMITRSLRLHLAKTPEQQAYAKGLRAGMDRARIEVAAVVALLAILGVFIATLF